MRAFTHREIVDIAHKWAESRHAFAVKEFVAYTHDIPDVMGFHTNYSTLIECKVSRSDFHRDKKKGYRSMPEIVGMGNYRIYCAPKGLLTINDLPEKWALLEVDDSGRARLSSEHGNIYKYDRNSIFWWDTTLAQLEQERKILLSIGRRAKLRGFMPEICKAYNDIAAAGEEAIA